MLKLMHKLRLPLAVKCLLLFGAGVAVVLAAALWVPWQRMEQLTQQLNEKAASAVVGQTIAEHSAAWSRSASTTRPATRWDRNVDPLLVDDRAFLPPRLIPLSAADQPDLLTRFDQQAMAAFASDPERRYHWRSFHDGYGYRYAEPVYLRGDCLSCHAADRNRPVPDALSEAFSAAAARREIAADPPDAGDAALGATGLPDPATRSTGPLLPQPGPLLGIVSVEIPSQIEAQQLTLNRMVMLGAGLLAGLLAIVVFYLITTRLILQPVRVLQETCEKVSQGDLNIRSDVNTGDEFQQLSETFNAMLKNLQESADQLRAVNKSLDLKLGQLAETNVALYESNRLKSEFLANVSHELRTPLNSILGFAELLNETAGRPAAGGAEPRSARFIQNILSSGRGLLLMINELLDLAKIEAGRMEVRSEPLILSDLFEGLVSVLKPLTQKKDLTIRASISNDVPILQTDAAKVQQILYNFLSNAIKFSPQGQAIALSAERDGLLSIRIEVTDRGPGVPADKFGVLFEKFRQIDGSHTREHGGTGLGLAIARELAHLLGGEVGVRSEPGQGATFWLTLPLRTEAGTKDVRETLVMT
jgi:signal transduction histidine kinase